MGKKIVTNGSTINIKESGDTGEVLFKLEGEASKVMIRILDDKNNIVGEIWKEGMSQGSHQINWDGIGLDGAPAPKGSYKAQVKAWDLAGNSVGARTEATGIVQSVTFDQNGPVLTVNGQKVFLHDVQSFHTPETQTHVEKISPLSGHNGSLQLMNNAVETKSAPSAQKAVSAYVENTGIYD